jgi:hypothetical protein
MQLAALPAILNIIWIAHHLVAFALILGVIHAVNQAHFILALNVLADSICHQDLQAVALHAQCLTAIFA